MARAGAKAAILVAEEGSYAVDHSRSRFAPPTLLSNTITANIPSSSQPKNTPPFDESTQLLARPPPLPAIVRLHHDHGTSLNESLDGIQYIQPPLQLSLFATNELSITALNALAPHLWIAGIPGTIRPLHQQLSLDRQILVTERIGLHLLWTGRDIYLKPLPPFLLNHASYTRLLCNPTTDAGVSPYLLACAHTLLLTYTRLITHPSDLAIAHTYNLLPSSITFEQWAAFCTSLLTSPSQPLPPRYRFGELRLSRINLLCRLTSPRTHLVRGYFWNTNRYTTFLSHNFRWLLTLLFVLGVTLNAFQLALATEQGRQSGAVNDAAWGLCLVSLVAMADLVVVTVVVLGGGVVTNAAYSWRKGRKGRKGQGVCVTWGGKQVC